MSNREDEQIPPVEAGDSENAGDVQTGTDQAPEQAGHAPEPEEKRKLDLTVEITPAGPCKKHIKVVIPPEETKRQYGESLKSVRREAAVPGFRPGRAPATLVQKRFKKEVAGQVKSSLLMAALQQIDEDYKVNPISRPELDLDAIELPEDEPLTFEMDVEVQPEFQLPNYKGLTVQRPVRAISEADVDAQLQRFLERYAQEVPKTEGTAQIGDLITSDIQFEKDGVLTSEAKELKFRLMPVLRLQDGVIPNLGEALVGAKPGDVREAQVEIGLSSPDPALRGQTLRGIFHVLDLKTLRLPEVDHIFLSGIGFDSLDELRTALRGILERRAEYQQRQAIRRGILDQLVDQTPFDLPADLVSRQEKSTLRNLVAEMRQSGLSDSEIRAREAELRANAHEATLRNLKEFFILARIADETGLKVEDEDIDLEIEAIAARSDESPRRVRARVEKEGLGESLATQILERKTLDKILETTKIEDVTVTEQERSVETLDETVAQVGPEDEDQEPAGTSESPAEGA